MATGSATPSPPFGWIEKVNFSLFPKAISSSVHGAIAVKWSPDRLIQTRKLTALKNNVQ